MTSARIVNKVAVDVAHGDPSKVFTPDIAAQFVSVPDRVRPQWRLLQMIDGDGQLAAGEDWFSPLTYIEPYDDNGTTRYRYAEVGTSSPPPPAPKWSDANLDPRYHWIDVGPFMDRFGAKAVAIAGSSDATVRGMVMLMQPRKYIDLKRQDVADFVGILHAGKGLITEIEAQAILSLKTTEEERHIKGLAQPTD